MAEKRAKNVFITGANSGLGLEMVKQLLKLGPENIFATYRNPARSQELMELGKLDPRVHAIQIDVRHECQFVQVLRQVYEVVKEDGINLLINNAGIFTEQQGICDLDKKTFLEFLEVNTVTPVIFIKDMLPLLEKAAKQNPEAPLGLERCVVANITSAYGSISSNNEGGFYYSRCCRAALNAASKSLGIDLKEQNILVAALSPGWVRTEQGGPNAPLSTEESVAGMIKVLQDLDETKTGIFVDYAGKEITW
jgi:NAD(P)-dependent dehydrogenase (short-subunit alcohol dehydrogenase family)